MSIDSSNPIPVGRASFNPYQWDGTPLPNLSGYYRVLIPCGACGTSVMGIRGNGLSYVAHCGGCNRTVVGATPDEVEREVATAPIPRAPEGTAFPALKRKLYVRETDDENLLIRFNADPETAALTKRLGYLHRGEYGESWQLVVDGRYDFSEVVAFVRGLDAPL